MAMANVQGRHCLSQIAMLVASLVRFWKGGGCTHMRKTISADASAQPKYVNSCISICHTVRLGSRR